MPNSAAIKVIISDLDGTLLNNHHQISDFTKHVFRELHKENYIFIIATGRHHLDAMPIVETLGIPYYLVTSNGARIHSPEKELLYAFNLDSAIVKSVLALDIDADITTVLFRENVWQANKNNEQLNSFQTEMNYVSEIVDFKTLEDLSGIKLFFTHDNHEKLVALKDTILTTHSDVFEHAFSLPICLELMHKSVDKSVAIGKILEIENSSFQNAISFGDGFNDEKMLNAVYKGLIMQNAPAGLKEKLSHLEVISSNHEDGVAHYLNQKMLEKSI